MECKENIIGSASVAGGLGYYLCRTPATAEVGSAVPGAGTAVGAVVGGGVSLGFLAGEYAWDNWLNPAFQQIGQAASQFQNGTWRPYANH